MNNSNLAADLVDGFESGIIPDPLKWLMSGGGGYEGWLAELNALTVTGVGLVHYLEAYRDDILAKARTVSSYGEKKEG